jgi:hypothetical protein
MQESDDVAVLFIAGNGRSGSTILHNILGQIDGFAAVGELRYIWQRGVVKNMLCGCQRPFDDCDVWHNVLDHAFGGVSETQARQWAEMTESFRSKNLPMAAIPRLRERQLARLDELLTVLARLYSAIRAVTGCRVIVDSSKNPSFGYLVRHAPGVDARFVHLIRDPSAVAYSWGQKKEFQPGVMMSQKSPARAALQWNSRNAMTEAFLGADHGLHRLRYEDFLVDPRAAVAEIVEWIGEAGAELPFSGSHAVDMDQVNHTVFGNEVRFARGEVMLRVDERWTENMAPADARIVKSLTWPLRRRYGYIGTRSRTEELFGAGR